MLVPAAAQIIRVWSLCYGQGPISQADQIGGTARVLLESPDHFVSHLLDEPR